MDNIPNYKHLVIEKKGKKIYCSCLYYGLNKFTLILHVALNLFHFPFYIYRTKIRQFRGLTFLICLLEVFVM